MEAMMKIRGRALRFAADLLPTKVMFQHGSRATRKVALTFDDGPGPLTESYLRVLDDAKVKATFFVIGRQCEEHRDVLAALARSGHEIAGHGWSHTPFSVLRGEAIAEELARTNAVLPAPARLVRPPFGKVNPLSLLASFRAGYTCAMWSIDPLDWRARTADEVVRSIDPKAVRGGDIILLHEERSWTLGALPDVIARLRDEGFELATVSDLVP